MHNHSNPKKIETSNAVTPLKCQASYYWANKHKVWCKVRPYNQENPNEIIFADGSKLVFGIPGQLPTVVVPPPGAILAACDNAYRKGWNDRLGRCRYDPNFRKESRRHIPRVRKSYADGFFGPLPWPRRGGTAYNK